MGLNVRHLLDREIMTAVGNGSKLAQIAERLGLGPSDYRDLQIRLAHLGHCGQVVRVAEHYWASR